jgi:hypothetical protein
MSRARINALLATGPLVLVLVSLAMTLLAAGGPCPTPDSGGC